MNEKGNPSQLTLQKKKHALRFTADPLIDAISLCLHLALARVNTVEMGKRSGKKPPNLGWKSGERANEPVSERRKCASNMGPGRVRKPLSPQGLSSHHAGQAGTGEGEPSYSTLWFMNK